MRSPGGHPVREPTARLRDKVLFARIAEEQSLDFNYLYYRQQVELMRAEAAACRESTRAHRHFADLFGKRIEAGKALARPTA